MIKTLGCCDSGIGGLLVVNALHEAYPNLDIVFIADQFHLPYGDKSAEELKEYTHLLMKSFQKMGIHEVVVACNTLCSSAVDAVKDEYSDLHIYSIIEPTAAQLSGSSYEKIRVIATKHTIENHAYLKALRMICPNSEIEEIKATKLVPVIENGCDKTKLLQAVKELDTSPADAWVLGCTHFPLIRPYLKDCDIYDSNAAVVDLFKDEEFAGTGKVDVYTSGDAAGLKRTIQQLFNKEYKVHSIVL